jgi:hypothetical protein
MKGFSKILGAAGLLLISAGAVMGFTNPDPADYRAYATEQLTQYAKGKVCQDASETFGLLLKQQCIKFVETSRPRIQRAIESSTHRQNFFVFSLYKTNFSISPLLPSYHFETLAIFQDFYTYRSEQR